MLYPSLHSAVVDIILFGIFGTYNTFLNIPMFPIPTADSDIPLKPVILKVLHLTTL